MEDFQDIMALAMLGLSGSTKNSPPTQALQTYEPNVAEQRTDVSNTATVKQSENHQNSSNSAVLCFSQLILEGLVEKYNLSFSFLSSRLSQFTKATRIFTTRDYTHTNVAAEFHQACDNIPNTLVIIKSGQYIAGGHTEGAWSSTF